MDENGFMISLDAAISFVVMIAACYLIISYYTPEMIRNSGREKDFALERFAIEISEAIVKAPENNNSLIGNAVHADGLLFGLDYDLKRFEANNIDLQNFNGLTPDDANFGKYFVAQINFEGNELFSNPKKGNECIAVERIVSNNGFGILEVKVCNEE
jgi:hypothetical protein